MRTRGTSRRTSLASDQRRLLELVLSGADLHSILTAAAEIIEGHAEKGLKASILNLKDGRLRHGAAPSLPPEFVAAIDGVQIGPNMGSCGTAAYLNQTVSVSDIEHDPRWAGHEHVALRHGLRACWATPIRDGRGEVLGTFAVYRSECGPPDEDYIRVIELLTRTVAIAIERSADEAEVRRIQRELSEENARYAAVLALERELASIRGGYREIASTILDRMLKLLVADGACLEIVDGDEVVFEDARGRVAEFVGERNSSANGLSGVAIRTGVLVSSEDAAVDVRADPAMTARMACRSALLVPLRYDDRCIGVLSVLCARPQAFGEGEAKMLEMLAGFLGATIGRARAEAALRESEAHYRFTVDLNPQTPWTTDPEGYLTDTSDRWTELTGLTREQSLDGGWVVAIHEEDLPGMNAKWSDSLATGNPYDVEHRVVLRDGSYRWMRSRARPRRDAEGRIIKWYGFTEDVHSQKVAELDLERLVEERTAELQRQLATTREAQQEVELRQQRYRFLAEAIPLPVWTRAPDWTLTFVNETWRRQYGIDPSAGPGAWLGHVHPADLARVHRVWRIAVLDGLRHSIQCRLKVGDAYRWHLCVATPEIVDGRIIEWIGTNVDIHDQIAREQLLEIANRAGRILAEDLDFDRIVQALTDLAVEATDARFGAFVMPGPSGYRTLAASGISQAEFEEVLLGRAPELIAATLNPTTPEGDFVMRVEDLNDDPRYAALAVRSYLGLALFSRTGETIGGLLLGHPDPLRFTIEQSRIVASFSFHAAVAIDNARLYDRQAKLNEELIAARDMALDASRAKTEFLANMSHEIRTPLNGVLGMASLLADLELPNEAKEMAETICTSGQVLLRLIDGVLDLAKIEAGRMEIEPAPADLNQIVEDTTSLFRGSASAKGIAFLSPPVSDLPPLVLVDSLRLRQVLANLVSNALKFTDRGHVELRYSWSANGPNADFRISVADTGIGIPVDRRTKIFDSFTQADGSIQRRYGGTGLGLTISRRLVDLMGGQLYVESELGIGSTFTVELTLPRAAIALPNAALRVDPAEPGIALSVLVAEDNAVNVLVIRRLLERCGCSVDVVGDGNEAIAAVASGKYDLVLMDIQMPNCDGLEATRAIRAIESRDGLPRHRIIALTANAMEQDRVATANAGMDGFLAKPLSLDSIRELLASRPST